MRWWACDGEAEIAKFFPEVTLGTLESEVVLKDRATADVEIDVVLVSTFREHRPPLFRCRLSDMGSPLAAKFVQNPPICRERDTSGDEGKFV